jgi:hypothetical protein
MRTLTPRAEEAGSAFPAGADVPVDDWDGAQAVVRQFYSGRAIVSQPLLTPFRALLGISLLHITSVVCLESRLVAIGRPSEKDH